jgi:uncharacterized protein
MASSYHAGERRVQERAGVIQQADRRSNAISNEIPPIAAQFLAEQVMVFVGHRGSGGAVWASVLSGPAGFTNVEDPRTVRVDARPAAGDALGIDLQSGPLPVGMLAIEPQTRRRMRINGIGELRDGAFWLRAEQVVANCPKYISTRHPVEIVNRYPEPEPQRDGILDERAAALIARADTFFIATTHANTGADVSHRGGNPGFVRVSTPSTLTWPDYTGNSMFMTLGNLELDARAGLLFPDWDTADVLQITGTARTDWDEQRTAAWPGAERLVDFTVDQAIRIPGALAWHWELETLSRFNPPAPTRLEGATASRYL